MLRATLWRTGEPEQLDHREHEQRRAEPDQAKPGLHDLLGLTMPDKAPRAATVRRVASATR